MADPKLHPDQLLTEKEASLWLGLGKTTLTGWRALARKAERLGNTDYRSPAADLSFVKLGSRMLRYRVRDLAEFAKNLDVGKK